MAEVKGKFITMASELIKTKPQARELALQSVKQLTGRDPGDLDPEGWYDTTVLAGILSAVERTTQSQIAAWAAIVAIGQSVYPTIRDTVGFPTHLETPLDFIKFKAQTFRTDHRGDDLVPRRILKAEEGDVLMEAVSPGYNCALIEGVYSGILELCHIKTGKVVQSKCIKRGDNTCQYRITW